MFLPPLSMSIDALTLLYNRLRHGTIPVPETDFEHAVSVLVPAYNEEYKLLNTIDRILQQTYPVKSIYILDDLSTDNTPAVCREIAKRHDKVVHVRRDSKLGKAGNINAIVTDAGKELGDLVLVVDGDVTLEEDCLEQLVKGASDAAVVTGYGHTRKPKSFLPGVLYEGESWINAIFRFRKKAQNIRHGIFVICGALSLYRRDMLESLPIPERTLTEDTDYTWLLQEQGFKVAYADKAIALGNNPNSFGGYWRRYDRWFSGTYQNLFVHGKDLAQSPSLFYATIVPSVIETIPYSIVMSTLPLAAFVAPDFAKGVLTADFILSLPFLFLHPRGFCYAVAHLPHIYAFKYFGSVAGVYTGMKTLAQKILGREEAWRNAWASTSQIPILPRRLSKRFMRSHMEEFDDLEHNWVDLGETPWTDQNYLFELPEKWKLSSYVRVDGAVAGYAIVSKKNEEEAYLHKILVDARFRGTGIGKRLFEDMIRTCGNRGFKKIRFKVKVDNEQANRLYRKMGVLYEGVVACPDGVNRYECVYGVKEE
ncbi:MAG: GNAT family N-acetyltransferase [Nanoarchaeota archaeon]